ncbi:unnamed protein product [Polarella glacialis]|uniref:Uncharacterized protein n=1 Tax=Polarella glacialis TaxID=89957 RepID=A0A813FBT4_POLGL|nr:unnamed protein product [Polarella glacialis]
MAQVSVEAICAVHLRLPLIAVGTSGDLRSQDGTLLLLSSASFRRLQTWPEPCSALAWHPEGPTLAVLIVSGQSSTVQLFTNIAVGDTPAEDIRLRCAHSLQLAPAPNFPSAAGCGRLFLGSGHLLLGGKELCVWGCSFARWRPEAQGAHFLHCAAEPELQQGLGNLGDILSLGLDSSERFLASIHDDGSELPGGDLWVWWAAEGAEALGQADSELISLSTSHMAERTAAASGAGASAMSERDRLLRLQSRALAIYEREDRRWHLEAWAARALEAKEQCLCCQAYRGDAGGFCSECSRAAQVLCELSGGDGQELKKTEWWPQDVDAAASEGAARSKMYEASLDERTNLAVQPAFMPPQTFRLLRRSLRSDTGGLPSPQQLATLLSDLAHPLLSAAQAGKVLSWIRSIDPHTVWLHDYEHVLCSRVVDKWNLAKSTHGSGECYYKPEEGLTHMNSSSETLVEALKLCSKPSNHEACWDDAMEIFVLGLMGKLAIVKQDPLTGARRAIL